MNDPAQPPMPVTPPRGPEAGRGSARIDADSSFDPRSSASIRGRCSEQVYHLYGLRVRSEIPLPAPVAADDSAACDLHVHWGERRPVAAAPPPPPAKS
jgi:hypothetical protein